jgi:hypothetical protein
MCCDWLQSQTVRTQLSIRAALARADLLACAAVTLVSNESVRTSAMIERQSVTTPTSASSRSSHCVNASPCRTSACVGPCASAEDSSYSTCTLQAAERSSQQARRGVACMAQCTQEGAGRARNRPRQQTASAERRRSPTALRRRRSHVCFAMRRIASATGSGRRHRQRPDSTEAAQRAQGL